jgi:glucan phosphorylase
MSLFADWKFKKPTKSRRVKQQPQQNELRVKDMIHEELQSYIKRDDLEKQLEKIERDKEKRRLWNSLSARKKLRLLRYLEGKKEASHGKEKKS